VQEHEPASGFQFTEHRLRIQFQFIIERPMLGIITSLKVMDQSMQHSWKITKIFLIIQEERNGENIT
jgi:hypothetical protein